MQWITGERLKVDRVAAPRLITMGINPKENGVWNAR